LLRSEVRKNREPNLKTSGQSIEDSESQSHIQDLIEKVANLEEKVETRNATITQLTDKLISLTEKNESLSFELERLRDQEGTSDKQDSKNQEIERLTLYNEELKRKLELLKLDLKEAQVSAENIEQELVRTKSERDISLPSSMMKKKQTQGGLLRGIAGLFLTDNDVESIH
jgi:chromosome segregation ATPase